MPEKHRILYGFGSKKNHTHSFPSMFHLYTISHWIHSAFLRKGYKIVPKVLEATFMITANQRYPQFVLGPFPRLCNVRTVGVQERKCQKPWIVSHWPLRNKTMCGMVMENLDWVTRTSVVEQQLLENIFLWIYMHRKTPIIYWVTTRS